jgi:hypothetical protein
VLRGPQLLPVPGLAGVRVASVDDGVPYALLLGGFKEEAGAWRDWLLRSVAGDPAKLQIMYGVAGERRLTELTLDWLPGYENSHPVRTGNAAVHQFQTSSVFGVSWMSMPEYMASRPGEGRSPARWTQQLRPVAAIRVRRRGPRSAGR